MLELSCVKKRDKIIRMFLQKGKGYVEYSFRSKGKGVTSNQRFEWISSSDDEVDFFFQGPFGHTNTCHEHDFFRCHILSYTIQGISIAKVRLAGVSPGSMAKISEQYSKNLFTNLLMTYCLALSFHHNHQSTPSRTAIQT